MVALLLNRVYYVVTSEGVNNTTRKYTKTEENILNATLSTSYIRVSYIIKIKIW